ncbi:hypothetical protein [Crocosphaera subtropica]|nr:hypothetical protein [Crocosphaera subtropica]
MSSFEPPYFEIVTPLGIKVRTTLSHWTKIITIKHPIMAGQENIVKQTLQFPTEIRRSKTDLDVYLYYKYQLPYFVCVVAKHLNRDGFIITAYRTNNIKRGDLIWTT